MKKGNYMLLICIAIVNAVVLYAGSIFFPTDIVLGNSILSPILAALVTGVLLSAIMGLPEPIIKALNVKIKNEMHLALVYLVFNILGLWILARLANYSGFGVSSYIVVIVLGLILNMLQYGVWKMLDGKKK